MGLLSTDITKAQRLSLKGVRLHFSERKLEPTASILAERLPTDEEITYSKLVAINPLIEELVERLGLVNWRGERIKRVEITDSIKATPF